MNTIQSANIEAVRKTNPSDLLSRTFAGVLLAGMLALNAQGAELDATRIEQAAGTQAAVQADGVVRIGWVRDDVPVEVDGMPFPPAAGLGSWAAFKATEEGAMVMGDTVVFQDEVDAAMDAAFAHGLEVTALHNHFFYDEPKVYFMHIGGQGDPVELAAGVKAVWDAIKEVREESPEPAEGFGGPVPTRGEIDADLIERITGLAPSVKPGGVVKISQGREGAMHEVEIGGSMGLGAWAAFTGDNELASMDGDFIMMAHEVQPVLKSLRRSGVHVVALHNHMLGEKPAFYFTHFWGKGSVETLARAFYEALEAQAEAEAEGEEDDERGEGEREFGWDFEDTEEGELPNGWRAEATHPDGQPNPWLVLERAQAASSGHRVLALPETPRYRRGTFNLCWTDEVVFQDGEIEVKVKAGTGRVDQGGGPIWRVQDADNYYVARWNPLEDNFRVYYVKAGRRVQLDSAEVEADPDQWHTIEIEQEGDRIECYFDGEKLLEVKDQAISQPGGVGLWTKADAATFFDDFEVESGSEEE